MIYDGPYFMQTSYALYNIIKFKGRVAKTKIKIDLVEL